MSKISHPHRAMVALATSLALESVQDENHALTVQCLARVLPRCSVCPAEMLGLRRAAEQFVGAPGPAARSAALIWLTQEVRRYQQLVAGAYIDAIRAEAGKGS